MYKLLMVIWLGVTVLAFGQSSTTGAPLPDSAKLEIIHAEKALYPIKAAQDGRQGRVVVKVTVSETGEVEKAEVVSGDEELQGAALKAARKFKFKPFIRGGKPVRVATALNFDFAYSQNVKDIAEEKTDGGTLGQPKIRLSQDVSKGLIIHKVIPVYPAEARANHIQGTVLLQAVIGKDGSIIHLRPIKGPAELIPAALGAVQQWQYRPYLLNGEPVEVDTQITVNFVLSGW